MDDPDADLLRRLLERGFQLRSDGRDLSLRAPREAWTADLRAAVAARKAGLLARLEPGKKLAPASRAQEDLWLRERLAPGGTAYAMPEAEHLRGIVDVALMAASWCRIVHRHEALRTTLAQIAGRLCQVVDERAGPVLTVIDLSGLSPARRKAEARRLAVAEARRPFDLEHGPLLRVALVCLTPPPARPGDSVLLRNVHHAVFDAASEAILESELARLYSAALAGRPAALAEPPLQYADVAARERLRPSDESLAFWRRHLAGAPAPLELPADRPRATDLPRRGALMERPFGAGLAERLRARGRRAGTSLFMTALAAFAVLLGRVAGRRDVVIGTTTAGRDRPELEGLIGFFVHTLALRVRLDGDPALAEVQAQVRDTVLAALAHQDASLEEAAGDARRPLFKVVFQGQTGGRPPELPGVTRAPLELPVPAAKFDLVVSLREVPGGLTSSWHFDPERFDVTTVRRLAERFVVVLGADPARRLAELPAMTAAERHQLEREWHDGPDSAVEVAPLDELLRRRAAAAADAVAVTCGGRQLSYGALAHRAAALAGRLRSRGAGRGSFVALWLDRSPELVVAIAGTLAAGAAYVPVDPAGPSARAAFVFADAGARLLVTTARLLERLPEPPAACVLLDDEELEAPPAPDAPATPDDAAYAIYTSGSTGRPKGVVVSHARVARLLAAARQRFHFGPADAWTLFHSYAFDFSVWEIWGALAHGGRLVVAGEDAVRSPGALRELVTRERVTVLSQTPSAFRLFAPAGRGAGALRYVVFGGEALAPASLSGWVERHGDARPELINMYGITETTVHVTFRRLTAADVRRPAGLVIGRPLPGWRVHVLDARLRPLPIGSAGELGVTGAGVARGYLSRPGLTARRFVPDPWSAAPGARLYRSGDRGRHRADGELEYLGRLDRQVQIRGYRVEPGEVEAQLARHPDVREAAVVAREAKAETALIAYLVPETGRRLGLAEVRRFLAATLPEPMLPTSAVALERLPLTVHGKVDRAALPAPAATRPELSTPYVEPATPLERFLAGLWAETLEIDRVGARDDFFELGGTSIRGALLINRLQEELDEILHVVTIFDHPTVAALAAHLLRQHAGALARRGLTAARAPAEARRRRVGERDLERFIAALPRRGPAHAAAPSNPPAVFILAPPRSGTTLLRVMLGGHPRLFAPPELELLSFDSMARRRAVFSGRLRFWCEGLVRAAMEAHGLAAGEAARAVAELERRDAATRDVYRWLQEALPDRLLVDKTPSYALDPAALARAEAWFDRPRYLHLVRHPCAVVHSFVEAKLDLILWHDLRGFGRPELAELHWLAGHRNVLGFLGGVPRERRHRIRFEELVHDPRGVLEGVCRFLGLDFDPAITLPYDGARRRMTDGPLAGSRPLGDVKFARHAGVDPASADRWRGRTQEEALGAPTWKLASRLGYPRAAPRDELPLSFAQQRLWFLQQLDRRSAAYNIPAAFELDGDLDVAALSRTLGEIVRRHEVLRTTFPARRGRPRQVISAAPVVALPVADLAGLPAPRKAARRLLRDDARRPFDLARGPLLRLALMRLEARRHLLAVHFHHIVTDGWSQGVLRREIGELYRAFARGEPSPLAEPPLQYAGYALRQRRELAGAALAGMLADSRRQLAGIEPIELPTDRPRPAVQDPRGAARDFELDAVTSAALRRLAERHSASLFMTLLAGFTALVARVTGRDDVAVGAPVAGRHRRELEGLIGLFVNLLVIRCDLAGNPAFGELLARTRRRTLAAYAHQEVPFEKLVGELAPARETARPPLVPVVLAMADAPATTLVLPGLTVRELEVEVETARFDLELFFREEDGRLRGGLVYAAALYDATTMARLADQLRTLLRSAVAAPGRRLAELPLLDAAARHQLAVEWSAGPVAAASGRLMHEILADKAADAPDAVAVAHGAARVSFRELARRIERRSRELRRSQVGPETVVGVLAERSLATVVEVLAVLAAGGAYLALDPRDSAARRAALLAEAGRSSSHGAAGARADNPAYVLFTSGSTGRPKGVVVTHRALASYLGWAAGAYATEPGGVPWHSSLAFDLTVTSFFVPLLAAPPLVIVPESRGTESLEGALARSAFSLLKITPAHLALLGDGGDGGAACLVVGGEALDGERISPWRRRFPRGRIVNEYGPTEATVGCAAYEVPAGPCPAGPVPIGRPLPGLTIRLLDRRLRTLPLGAPGELCVAGSALARGYLGQGATTAAVFVPDPFARRPGERLYKTGDLARHLADGTLVYLGRHDRQLKVRGVRLEPAEIEAALRRHDAVSDAAVVAREEGDARRLVAYAVARREVDPGELEANLRRALSRWSVPSAIVVLDAFPLLPSGKVDRAALAGPAYAPVRTRHRAAAPRTRAEATLARIWSVLLGIDEIGPDDDFFALGGDSLLCLQVVARLREEGLRLRARDFFRHPTLAALAAAAEEVSAAAQRPPSAAAGPVPLTPAQRWFFELNVAEPGHFNHALLLTVRRPLAAGTARRAVARLLACHESLRLAFTCRHGDWSQTVAPFTGGVAFVEVDLSRADDGQLERVAHRLQWHCDLARGMLLRAAWLDLGSGRPARLLLVVHHLGVDAVSWRALLEDLERACRDEALPEVPTPFSAWARRLPAAARSEDVRRDLDAWLEPPTAPLPADGAGVNSVASADRVKVALKPAATRRLLRAASAHRIDELMLAALVRTCAAWTGDSRLRLDLEEHGRTEAAFGGVDLSRTVGWLTAIFPVVLEDAGDPRATLAAVHAKLSGRRCRGLGYGLLRYLAGDPRIAERLAALPSPEVSFNYLGRLDSWLPTSGSDGDELFAFADEPTGPDRSPRGLRTHLLEVLAYVREERLQVVFTFSRNRHRRSTVERLARGFLSELRGVLAATR